MLMKIIKFNLTVLLFVAAVANADQVMLDNGDRISGRIMSLQEGWLVMESDYAGEISIDWYSVNGITSDVPLSYLLENGDRITGQAVMTSDGLSIASTTLGSLAVPMNSIVAIGRDQVPLGAVELQAAQETIASISEELDLTRQELTDTQEQLLAATEVDKLWSGNISLQLGTKFGNREEYDAYLSAVAMRKTESERLTLRADGGYGETESVVDTTELRGQINQRVFLNEDYYIFGDLLLEHDRFEAIDFRMNATAGAGYSWYNTDERSLFTDVGFGIMYEVDDFGGSTTDPTARLGLEYQQKLWEASQFNQLVTLYPSLGDIGEFRLIAQTDFSTPINESLSWLISIINEYNSDPPRIDIKKHDISIRTGLQYNF